MQDWQLKAREGIRDTLATYNWCGDNGDLEGFAGTMAPDGVLEIKGVGAFAGRAAVLEGARTGFGQPADKLQAIRAGGRLAHHVSSVRIELASETEARCWAYFVVFGQHGPDHWGRYTDRLVLVDGRWLFAHRRVSIDAASPGSPMAA